MENPHMPAYQGNGFPDQQTEPVRVNGYTAAAIAAVSTFLLAVAVLDPVTWQTLAGAAGAALAQFGVLAFGVERARDRAWAPASVDRLRDGYLEAVDQLASAEAALSTVTIDDIPE
jgi:hypothetical protein